MPAASISSAPALSVSESRATQRIIRLLSPGPALTLHTRDSAQRSNLECYIANQFRAIHNAEIHEYLPYLLSLSCAGNFTAAAGLRPARGQKLFLERYLDGRVEVALERVGTGLVSRNHVVEIGNLAATQRGFSQLLFLLLTAVLQQTRFEWVVFTATPVVQKTLRHLGFELHTLGEADPSTLEASERSDWGRYYECRPQVVAGHVASATSVLATRRRHRAALAMYDERIRAVAAELNRQGTADEIRSIAA